MVRTSEGSTQASPITAAGGSGFSTGRRASMAGRHAQFVPDAVEAWFEDGAGSVNGRAAQVRYRNDLAGRRP